MSFRLTVGCDDDWDQGRFPCRAKFPSRETTVPAALWDAVQHGWSHTSAGHHVRCPSHTRLSKVSP